MAIESGLQASYLSLCQARLNSAGLLLRQYPECHKDTGIEGVIARCNISMLVWSGGIDLGASLMIQENHHIPGGKSGEITAYISCNVDDNHPELGLRLIWRDLIRLHNIQHRADHQMARFIDSCRASRGAFSSINRLLLPANRLVSESYEWLATVGEE